MTRQGQDGYVMLMNVLVICAAMLAISIAAAMSVSRSQGTTLTLERERAAQRLAEGCMEAALLKMQGTPAYAGNETVTIGGSPCTIRPVVSGPPKRVQVQATVNGETYKLEARVDDVNSVDVGQWKRVSAFN